MAARSKPEESQAPEAGQPVEAVQKGETLKQYRERLAKHAEDGKA